MMKKILAASAAVALLCGAANAEDVKLGVLLGFTGGAETLAPDMAAGAEAAMKEASDSGVFLGGDTITPKEADSTCSNTAEAVAAAERLVTGDGVKGIVGAICSGASIAVLQGVSVPNGIVQISPSSTSPALTTIKDNGYFFRTAPSDARQGEVIADMLNEMKIKSIALTYTNNDYGKGLADSIESSYEKLGGKVTVSLPHEDDKADYSNEVANLDSAGGDVLVVAGYADRGGSAIVRAALDSGAFDKFVFPDAMVSPAIEKKFGDEIDGSVGIVPGSNGPGAKMYKDIKSVDKGLPDKFNPETPYSAESYDAAALIVLAMQAANSTDPKVYKDKIMEVANGPGEKIYPGEIAKGLKLLADGKAIDYEGATGVRLVDPGEAAGSYRQIVIKGGKITTVGYR